jgi:type IV secretion system protein VirB9
VGGNAVGGIDAGLPAPAWIALADPGRRSGLSAVGTVFLVVNYRVRGRYYIVDRLFSEAELRLGEKPQQVVRIVRADAGHGRRRGL